MNKEISLRIAEDLRVLTEDFQVLADHFKILCSTAKDNDTEHEGHEGLIQDSSNNMVSGNDTKHEGHEENAENNENAENTEEEDISIERVRSVLSEKTKKGKIEEVRGLINKYGGKKLTDLNKACYKNLLKEAQNI